MFGLAVGGLDPSGGAGLIADALTFSSFGLKPQVVMTALTVQNASRFAGYSPADAGSFRAQLEMIFEAERPSVVKIGMLGHERIAAALADFLLKRARGLPVVLDTVFSASAGGSLLSPKAFGILKESLIPLASVVTPNLMEAEKLADLKADETRGLETIAERILALGAGCVLIKGGHLTGDPVDHFFDGRSHRRLPGRRIDRGKVRGTGCMFASALAAGLALGKDAYASAKEAKRFVRTVIAGTEKQSDSPQTGRIPRGRRPVANEKEKSRKVRGRPPADKTKKD